MRRLVAGALLAGVLALGGAGFVQAAGGEANRLLVEAAELAGQADTAEEPAVRAGLYKRALDNIDRIVAEHPASDLAVKLATGQPVGTLDRGEIERLWRLSRAEVCVADRDRLCVLDVALEVVKYVRDMTRRAQVMIKIVEGLAASGALDRALNTADLIELPAYHAMALSRIAERQKTALDPGTIDSIIARAIRKASQIGDAYRRSLALGSITIRQANTGDILGAKQTIDRVIESMDKIDGERRRVRVWTLLAEAQALTGDVSATRFSLAKAEEITGRIRDRLTKVEALMMIGWVQAIRGDNSGALVKISQALDIAGNIGDPYRKDVAALDRIDLQVEAGDILNAVNSIASIQSPFVRAIAYAFPIRGRFKLGDDTQALRELNSTLHLMKQLDDDSQIARVLAMLAWAVSECQSCKNAGTTSEF